MRRQPDNAEGRGSRETAPQAAPGRAGQAPNPARIFSIPPEVKHLEPDQMLAWGQAFAAWRAAARGPAGRAARGRVCLVFLLLRHTGARLGEVLALDERAGLDLAQGLVRLGGAAGGGEGDGRQVALAPDVTAQAAELLADPGLRDLAGQVLRLDQGYVRRLFQARARDCGLPRELAHPRVLRASRAIELLRQGLPLTIVQDILGQGTVNLTANYLTFAQEDRRRIVGFHLGREAGLRTSARNSFPGRVTAIRRTPLLAEVEMVSQGGHPLVSVITNHSLESLELRPGSPVTALIKAPWVILAQGEQPPRLSARNRLRGRVASIESDGLHCEVMVALKDGAQVCALITGGSRQELGLEPGDQVWAVFKSSAVILTVE